MEPAAYRGGEHRRLGYIIYRLSALFNIFKEVIALKVFFIRKKSPLWLLSAMSAAAFILISIFLCFTPGAVQTAYGNAASEEFIYKVSSLTSGEEKIAYLTFDDGPNAEITPKILDILKAENVKASFFVIGKAVEAHPEIVKRAYEEGHYIANHGYSHDNSVLYESSESFKNEIEKTDSAIGEAIGIKGYRSHIFRFPNGYMSPLYKEKKKEALPLLSKMNYAYIDWNCLNNDSMQKYTETQLLENLKKSAQGKGTLVVLMHDTNDVSDSSVVLKASIAYLRAQGYEFRNFYDC